MARGLLRRVMMHRTALVFSLLLSIGCGRKSQESAKAVAENEGRDEHRPCSVPASGVVDQDLTIGRGCTTIVERTLVVKNGAKLIIEPGATLAFERGTGLRIEMGAIVARGAPEAKIVFTSHASTKAAGDWMGITVADDGALTPSTIVHATIEYAGGQDPAASVVDAGLLMEAGAPMVAALPAEGAVTLTETAGRFSMDHVTVSHVSTAAIVARRAEGLVRCEVCSATDTVGSSIVVPAETLAVFVGGSFDAPVHVFGEVTHSLVWPKLVVPIHVDSTITIDSGVEKAPAVLDVGEGNTLIVHPQVDIVVGNAAKVGGGALVARKVRFTGVDRSNWGAIVLHDAPLGTVIDGCTFEHAGERLPAKYFGEPRAVIVLPTIDRGIVITHNHFVDDAAPAMGSETDCHGHDRPANGNTSKPQDMCWEDPTKALMMNLSAFDAGEITLKGSTSGILQGESINMIGGPGEGTAGGTGGSGGIGGLGGLPTKK